MAARARVVVNDAALAALLTGRNGPVVADLQRRGRNVANEAKRLCPVDQGRLRASITTELVVVAGVPTVRIGTNVAYARFVHEGTGLYGPRGAVIRPRSARVLSWPTRSTTPARVTKSGKRRAASRRQVPDGKAFARYTRGVRPRPFLRNALPAAGR